MKTRNLERTKTGKHKFEELSGKIISAAIEVHKQLGPGFLESIYEEALCRELRKRGIEFERQKEVKVFYDGAEIGKHRLDLIVEKEMVVELKTIQGFEKIHFIILKSYLKATGLKVGLLFNFSRITLEVKRIVN